MFLVIIMQVIIPCQDMVYLYGDRYCRTMDFRGWWWATSTAVSRGKLIHYSSADP